MYVCIGCLKNQRLTPSFWLNKNLRIYVCAVWIHKSDFCRKNVMKSRNLKASKVGIKAFWKTKITVVSFVRYSDKQSNTLWPNYKSKFLYERVWHYFESLFSQYDIHFLPIHIFFSNKTNLIYICFYWLILTHSLSRM